MRSVALRPLAALLALASCLAQTPPPPPKKAASPPSEVAGIPVNYDEAKVGSYTLPDPLTSPAGKRVSDAKTWNEQRRPQILRLFEENEYGRAPGRPSDLTFDVFDTGTPAMGGKAIRKQITIYFTSAKDGPKEDLVLY